MGIDIAARDRINDSGKALNANHPPYPVGCVSPAQGGVLEAVLLSGGVEGKAGSGGGLEKYPCYIPF